MCRLFWFSGAFLRPSISQHATSAKILYFYTSYSVCVFVCLWLDNIFVKRIYPFLQNTLKTNPTASSFFFVQYFYWFSRPFSRFASHESTEQQLWASDRRQRKPSAHKQPATYIAFLGHIKYIRYSANVDSFAFVSIWWQFFYVFSFYVKILVKRFSSEFGGIVLVINVNEITMKINIKFNNLLSHTKKLWKVHVARKKYFFRIRCNPKVQPPTLGCVRISILPYGYTLSVKIGFLVNNEVSKSIC